MPRSGEGHVWGATNEHLRARAMRMYESATKRAIRELCARGQRIARDSMKGPFFTMTAKGRRIYRAAAHGRSPHRRTGELKDSVDYEVYEERGAVRGRIGTNIPWGRYMELGFHDRNGVYHGPWPWLRPMLAKLENEVVPALRRKCATLPRD